MENFKSRENISKSTQIILFLLNNLIWVILLIFVLINIFITPFFFTYRNLMNILYNSTILGMLVLAEGAALLGGNFDLSIESTLAFAPAIGILFATKWMPGIGYISAIFITFAVGALIGSINGYCISTLKINPFLQTLAMLIILRGLTLYFVPFGIYQINKTYTFLGKSILPGNIPLVVIVMFIIFFFFQIIVTKMRFGRMLLSTGGNSVASFISGINTQRVILISFILSALLASLSGLIAAGRQAAVTNAMGENMVMLAFAGAVLGGVSIKGGIGTPIGMLGGALFMGVLSNALTLLGIQVYLVYAMKGLLILIAVFLDNYKIKMRETLFLREELKKLRKKDLTIQGEEIKEYA